MFDFMKKKSTAVEIEYNPDNQRPIIRCSICNGEQVAGFKDIKTGHFTEVMLIRDDGDLELFMERYGLSEVSKEY